MSLIPEEAQEINFNITKGFSNFGNTCFYNATLQSIFRCEDLITKLRDYKGQNQLLRYLKITIEDYFLKPVVETIGPVLLLKSYQQMNSQFIRGTQSDGEECLTYFLDNFQEATQTEGINITPLFDCSLASQLTCPNCNHTSLSNSPEKLITLPIKDYANFNDAFTHFLSDEILDDDNKFLCEKCNIKVAAKKKLIIRGRPKYLYIALKRFEHEWIKNLNRIKTTKIVNNILMPDVIMIETTGYKMKGCIFHMGGLNGGHYVYYNIVNGSWVEFNDTQINDNISQEEINNIINKGYVYLYEKC
jgi:ubiquitin C-terminal hydrolase